MDAMLEDDTRVFWALMFWQFHGLSEKDTAHHIGTFLKASYGEATENLPPALNNLLARLEVAEQDER
jgi:hypothetical protein